MYLVLLRGGEKPLNPKRMLLLAVLLSIFVLAGAGGASAADASITLENTTKPVYNTSMNVKVIVKAGNENVNGAVATVNLPEGLVVQDYTASQGYYDLETGTWEIGDVHAYEEKSLTLVCLVNTTQQVTVTANLTAEGDENPNNNQANLQFKPIEQADIQVTVTANRTTARMGETAEYTVKVKNNGPQAARDVLIRNYFSGGLILQDYTCSAGYFDDLERYWYIETLQAGEEATLTMTCLLNRTGDLSNYATIGEVQTHDQNAANNAGRATVTVPGADLQTIITAPTKTTQGKAFNIVVYAKNNGPVTAQNVKVNLQTPGIQVLNIQASRGSYSNGIWDIGELQDDEEAILNITAKYTQTGNYTLNGTVSSDAIDDSNTANNDDGRTINVAAGRSYIKLRIKNNSAMTIRIVLYITANDHGTITKKTYNFYLKRGTTRTLNLGTYTYGTSILFKQYTYNTKYTKRTVSYENTYNATSAKVQKLSVPGVKGRQKAPVVRLTTLQFDENGTTIN